MEATTYGFWGLGGLGKSFKFNNGTIRVPIWVIGVIDLLIY